MERVVKPELLDSLPANDPGAVGSRRDLQRLHKWMGHTRLMEGALRSIMNGEQPRRIVDLGAGDGEFTLRLARQLVPRWRDVCVTMVDQQEIVAVSHTQVLQRPNPRGKCRIDVFCEDVRFESPAL